MKTKIEIKGEYTFKLNFNVPLQGTVELTTENTNKITNEGKEFILNRLYRDIPQPIKYIVIGKGGNVETLKTNGSYRETSKVLPNRAENSIEFFASFTNVEMVGIEQIGLSNQEKGEILTHSVLNTPFQELPNSVTVDINYKLIVGE